MLGDKIPIQEELSNSSLSSKNDFDLPLLEKKIVKLTRKRTSQQRPGIFSSATQGGRMVEIANLFTQNALGTTPPTHLPNDLFEGTARNRDLTHLIYEKIENTLTDERLKLLLKNLIASLRDDTNASDEMPPSSYLLGILLVFLEKAPDKLSELVPDHPSDPNRLFNALVKRLSTLTDGNELLPNASPHLLTELILTTEGEFNLPVMHWFSKILVSDTPEGSFRLHLLKQIIHSADLRTGFEQLTLKTPISPQGEAIIRSTLLLPLNIPIETTHLKKTLLISLLSRIRQNETGCCFATFQAIQLQSYDPQKALTDFYDLITKGQLEKKVGNEYAAFPYLPRWGHEKLEEILEWDAQGVINCSNLSLWDLPELKAVSKALSLHNVPEKVQAWMKSPEAASRKIKASTLIEELGKKHGPQEIELAKNFFCAAENLPLHKVWESSLAGMAEGDRGGILNQALAQSIHYFIQKSFKKLKWETISPIYDTIEHTLLNKVQYLYDASYVSTLKPKSPGAFVLHTKKQGDFEPIRTNETFKKLVMNIIQEVFSSLSIDSSTLLENIRQDLCDSKKFGKFMKRYHRENERCPAGSNDFTPSRFTPWVTLIGNNPQKVLKIYYENDPPFKMEPLTCKDATELLFKLHALAPLLNKARSGNIPARASGRHAFNLLPLRSKENPLLLKDKEFENWWSEGWNKKAKKLTHTPMTPLAKMRLINNTALEKLPQEKRGVFIDSMEAASKQLSMKAFRDQLLEALERFSPKEASMEKLAKWVDKQLILDLPPKYLSLWKEMVIPLADSNWSIEGHDIHFAVAFNPGSGEPELMEVLDSGELHSCLNQNTWIKLHPWELFIPN